MSHDKASMHDIIESFELAMRYLGGRTAQELGADSEKLDAIIRRIEIIGEATKRLTRAFCDAHPQVPWREMAGMRDRVIHAYDRVDVHQVHAAVSARMPELIDELRRLRETLPDPE
jgi:uncharacterized protein with HEPN domain